MDFEPKDVMPCYATLGGGFALMFESPHIGGFTCIDPSTGKILFYGHGFNVLKVVDTQDEAALFAESLGKRAMLVNVR